jgi:hypothetical protein
MNDRFDELLNLIEIEPDPLRTAEQLNAQAVLKSLAGKTVTSAEVQETRVTVNTSDGCRFHFYGFLGAEKPN